MKTAMTTDKIRIAEDRLQTYQPTCMYVMWHQGCIEPPVAVRGYATYVDNKILKIEFSVQRESYIHDLLAHFYKYQRRTEASWVYSYGPRKVVQLWQHVANSIEI